MPFVLRADQVDREGGIPSLAYHARPWGAGLQLGALLASGAAPPLLLPLLSHQGEGEVGDLRAWPVHAAHAPSPSADQQTVLGLTGQSGLPP